MLTLTLLLLAADPAEPRAGSWSVDTTGTVQKSTLEALDELGVRVNDTRRAQLVVVVVPSTKPLKPDAWALQLARRWNPGHTGKDDGLVLVVALTDKRSGVAMGTGVPLVAAQVEPLLRDLEAGLRGGTVDDAILYAARDLLQLLTPTPDTAAELANQAARDEQLLRLVRGEEMYVETSPRHWVLDLADVFNASQRADLERISNDVYSSDHGRLFFLVVRSSRPWPGLDALVERLKAQVAPYSGRPVGVVALNLATNAAVLDVPVAGTSWNQAQVVAAKDALSREAVDAPLRALVHAGDWAADVMVKGVPPRSTDEVVEAGLDEHGPLLAFLGLAAFVGGLVLFWRWFVRRPRICKACGRPRELLDEVAEDAYLDPAQRLEEEWGATDFHVWRCGHCRDVELIRHSSWWVRLRACPKCGERALKAEAKLNSWPTPSQPGEIDVDETCARCGYTGHHAKTIPRLEPQAGHPGAHAPPPVAAHLRTSVTGRG